MSQQNQLVGDTMIEVAQLRRQLNIQQIVFNNAARFSTKLQAWKNARRISQRMERLQGSLVIRITTCLLVLCMATSCTATKKDCRGRIHYYNKAGGFYM